MRVPGMRCMGIPPCTGVLRSLRDPDRDNSTIELSMLQREMAGPELREDEIQEMLLLAARLREAHGGELDDAAIQAVSEATGAPTEYVRLALRSVESSHKQKPVSRWRGFFLSFDPDVRRYVTAGWLGCVAGFLGAMAGVFGDRSSFLGILTLLTMCATVWNSSQARDSKVGAIAGVAYAALFFVTEAAFLFLLSLIPALRIPNGHAPFVLLIWVAIGALVGAGAKRIVSKSLSKVGIKDANAERQDLLRQLVDLQDKLRSGEQNMTFLSIDMVGSTRMKEGAEPLAVEYTFSEYHNYVEAVTKRHGGAVHSTAGDGVICAFEDARQAFKAARNIQSGLIELNTHRNKLKTPIRLRIGMHTGSVIAVNQDVQSVNFAHVIDIAAHLQKVCPVGGVAVSAATVMFLPGGKKAVGDDEITAQGVAANVWQPRVALSAGAPSA